MLASYAELYWRGRRCGNERRRGSADKTMMLRSTNTKSADDFATHVNEWPTMVAATMTGVFLASGASSDGIRLS